MHWIMRVIAVGLLALGASRAAAQEADATLGVDALLRRSALVFRGPVLEVDLTAFNAVENKPYTRVLFGVEEVLYGQWLESTIEFTLPGGVFPDGRFSEWVGIPSFEVGETVVLYVRDGDWFITPVVGNARGILREVTVDGQRYLTDLEGRAVTGFSSKMSPVLGERIAESAQELLKRRALKAIRGVEADAREPQASSQRSDAPGSVAGVPRAAEKLSELRSLIKAERARSPKRLAAPVIRRRPVGPLQMRKE